MRLRTDHLVGDLIRMDGACTDRRADKYVQQIRGMFVAFTNEE